MRRLLLFALLCGFFIEGCKKDSPTPIYLIKSIIQYGSTMDTTTYTYDNANRVIGYSISYLNNYKIAYDSLSRVKECDAYVKGVLANRSFYTYSGNTITRKDIDMHGINSLNVLATLNNQGQIVKRDLGTGVYYTYAYDDLGNDTLYNNYNTPVGGNLPINGYSYRFDNNKSPYLNIEGNFYVVPFNPLSVNNIATAVLHVIISPDIIYNYQYTYNADGYPISQTLNGQPNAVYSYIIK